MSTIQHPLQKAAPNALPLPRKRKNCASITISAQAQDLVNAMVDLYRSSPIAREEWRLSAQEYPSDSVPCPPKPEVDTAPTSSEERRCAFCNAEFIAAGRSMQQKYCSESCRKKAGTALRAERHRAEAERRGLECVGAIKGCGLCGVKFVKSASAQRYCSQACAERAYYLQHREYKIQYAQARRAAISEQEVGA